MTVAEVVQPYHRERILAEGLAAAGHVTGELAGDMLTVAVAALDVAEYQRVIAGELERHRPSFLAPGAQHCHGRRIQVDHPRLA